ncbi:MAG: FadR/GntR family transcriptional regulator [Anaerolineae bacterium]
MNKITLNLLRFIIDQGYQPGDRLPSLNELSTGLGVNIGKVREEMAVARNLGLVEVKPRAGTRLAPYNFAPAVRLSLLFGLGLDRSAFEHFRKLRTNIEASFWHEGASLLADEDKAHLRALMQSACSKLSTPAVEIPHPEHRDLHMTIFRRLNNPFVRGIQEAYWDAYEAIELNRYADYQYWKEVWNYHQQIVDNLCSGDIEAARKAFIAHIELLPQHFGP